MGALTGIVLRLIFSGEPGGAFNAMNGAFVYLAPIAVGAVTVYVAEAKQRRNWSYYVWVPAAANTLFVLGTMAILIEGLICVVIILPLFCVLGAFGGLLMGVICRATQRRREAVYSFAVLPILLSFIPTPEANLQRVRAIERTIFVEAKPPQIWQQIHDARDIRPEEVGRAWMYRIGVPLPLAGVTQKTPTGFIRKISMGKSIHFEQVATEWQENQFVRWAYRFEKDSFPPKALDDHVTIGGHYFDLLDTEYKLRPTGPKMTELSITMRYRVSTQFNWYADNVARLLIGNFEEVILDFYRKRSIQAG
ncbi:MAG: SRPBCC domain-containing protein [Ramlibacter sp.]|nr:SRPBCC domain-containing protein [Ramlibacter sp.]